MNCPLCGTELSLIGGRASNMKSEPDKNKVWPESIIVYVDFTYKCVSCPVTVIVTEAKGYLPVVKKDG